MVIPEAVVRRWFFLKRGVLKNFAKIHSRPEFFINKVAG